MNDTFLGLDAVEWTAIATITLTVVAALALFMNGRAGRHARRAAEAAERAAEASQQSARVAERTLQLESMPIVLPATGLRSGEFHGDRMEPIVLLRNNGRQTALNGRLWLRAE